MFLSSATRPHWRLQLDRSSLSGDSLEGLSTLIDKMQGQKLYAHIDLRKGERSELAELASDIL